MVKKGTPVVFLEAGTDATAPVLRGAPPRLLRRSEDIAAIDNDVTDVDANAELDPLVIRHVTVSLEHSALDLDRTAQRVHRACELD
jgi:hypothetical protein